MIITKRFWNGFPAALAGVALALFAAGCEKASPPSARPPASVTVNQPIQREVVEWDQYPGRLAAVDMVEVRAKVSGYLDSIHFKDGAEVKKGDLLFVIDPRPFKAESDRSAADLAQAESKFELASNDFDRAERLLKSKAISEEDADSRSKAKREAAAAIESARAMLETARLNLDYTRITSPIDGRISRRMVTEGNLVNGSMGQTTLLTTIVSLDPVYCYFDADETAVLKFQKLAREGAGDDFRDGKVPCEAELANETNFPHHGVLDFVDNRVDPATGTLRVRGIFPNPAPDRVLQPGFFARVRVHGSAKYSATLIPDLAVGTDQSQKFVYVVNDKNIVEYRTVRLGPLADGLRIVRSGLQSNDWIIVNGLMSVRPGAPVNPVKVAIGAAPTQTAANNQP